MNTLRLIAGVVAILALAACLIAPYLYFRGVVAAADFKTVFLVASVAWFLGAWYWAREREPVIPHSDLE